VNFLIAEPTIGEQKRISAFLDEMTVQLDRLSGRIYAGIERLKELRARLIGFAVTGQIDVRGETT
jgi:restriction endonuclease S subunit